MKTLYKNSRSIAAAIVGTLVFSTGAALAITGEDSGSQGTALAATRVADMGRFVVTPKTANYVHPAEEVGRFVVNQHSAVYIPAA